MINLHQLMKKYIEHCEANKRLDKKTLKAYRIDLKQFSEYLPVTVISDITPELIENYIAILNKKYQPKTVKRKIASIKAFFHFLEYKDLLPVNPFNKLQINFREPVKLPRTIPLHTIEIFLSTIYSYQKNAKTLYQRRNALRDAAEIKNAVYKLQTVQFCISLMNTIMNFTMKFKTVIIFLPIRKELLYLIR